jgi:hypothetical protein
LTSIVLNPPWLSQTALREGASKVGRESSAKSCGSTYAADRVLESKERPGEFALLRAGALTEGTISNWRFDNGLLLRLKSTRRI